MHSSRDRGYAPVRRLGSILVRLPIAAVLLLVWGGVPSRASGNVGVHLQFDLGSLGQTINNKWSSVNAWAYQESWTGAQDRSQDYFSTHFPFIDNVQLMSATGGCFVGYPNCSNITRDLFSAPADTTKLTDYSFAPLIQVIHNILNQGLSPWIKTGSVPIKLVGFPSISTAFNVNKRPPDNYDVYYAYIKACAQALVNEFGLAEVRTWKWGVLTEFENPDWFETTDNSPVTTANAYFKLYDYTVAALESVIGADYLNIGAHCTCFTQKLWDPLTFIDHVANGINAYTGRRGTHIDYLAMSFYEDSPGHPGDLSATTDHLSLVETVNRLRNRAIADGLTHLQYGIDEAGILAGPDGKSLGRYALGDSYQGSWDALLFKKAVDADISWISQWDLSSNHIWDGLPFVGTHIAELSYKMTSDQVVSSETVGLPIESTDLVEAIAGYDPATHTAHVMVFNHNPSMNARQSEPITISLPNVTLDSGSTAHIRKWQVDDSHGNFWPLWWADMQARDIPDDHYGYSRYWVEPAIALLDPADHDYFTSRLPVYAQAAALNSTTEEGVLNGNTLTLTPLVAPHGVVFYEITNISPQTIVLFDH